MRGVGLWFLCVNLLWAEAALTPIIDMQLFSLQRDLRHTLDGEQVYGSSALAARSTALGLQAGAQWQPDRWRFRAVAHSSTRLNTLSTNPHQNDIGLLDHHGESFAYLAEASAGFQTDRLTLTTGRQLIDTGFIGANQRMLPSSYEALRLSWRSGDWTSEAIYLHRIAASSASNSAPPDHPYGALGYGRGYQVGRFVPIGTHILGSNAPDLKAAAIGLHHTTDRRTIGGWGYAFEDLFWVADLRWQEQIPSRYGAFALDAGVLWQQDMGANLYGERHHAERIDSRLYQARLGWKEAGSFAHLTASRVPANPGTVLNGTLISPLSVTASEITGLTTNHANIADTDSVRLVAGSRFDPFGVPLVAAAGVIDYQIGSQNGFAPGTTQHTREHTLHLQSYFSPESHLTLQVSEASDITPLLARERLVRLILRLALPE